MRNRGPALIATAVLLAALGGAGGCNPDDTRSPSEPPSAPTPPPPAPQTPPKAAGRAAGAAASRTTLADVTTILEAPPLT